MDRKSKGKKGTNRIGLDSAVLAPVDEHPDYIAGLVSDDAAGQSAVLTPAPDGTPK